MIWIHGAGAPFYKYENSIIWAIFLVRSRFYVMASRIFGADLRTETDNWLTGTNKKELKSLRI